VLICEPEKARPYQPEELAEARLFVDHLLARNARISQQDLNQYLEAMDTSLESLPTPWTAFINGGLYSPPASESPFRDATEFTVDAVLSNDLAIYCQLQKMKDPRSDGYIVPVPRYLAQFNNRLNRGVMEAPSSQYSSEYGFQSAKVPEYAH